jgi:hypothetical protein
MPQFTVNGIGLANLGGMALPMFTIEGSQQNLASADWTLPMFTTNTVAQQGFVHSMFATLPQLSVLGYAGQTIGIALPSLTLEAHGSTGYLAIFDYSLPRMTIKVVAEQQETGTFNVSLPRFNLSGNLLTGIVSMPGSNRILPMFTTNLHAYRGENGDGAVSLPMFTTATFAPANPDGTLVQSLKMFTLDAFADVYTNRII